MRFKRFEDWPRRLDGFVRERRNMPYEYGVNDCACFVRAWVLTATGVDLMPAGITLPNSTMSAVKFLLARGHDDMEGLATELLGAPLSTPKLAQRGDIISFEGIGDKHLAVCIGVDAVTPGLNGLMRVLRQQWSQAWHI